MLSQRNLSRLRYKPLKIRDYFGNYTQCQNPNYSTAGKSIFAKQRNPFLFSLAAGYLNSYDKISTAHPQKYTCLALTGYSAF